MSWLSATSEAGTFYVWFVLPFTIFVARLADMTLDTIRIVCVARGQRMLATVLGFFEILIWLFAISQALTHIAQPINAIAYAAGFAAGNYVGMTIERHMALGKLVLRTITRHDADELIKNLYAEGFGLTVVPGEGKKGPVKLLFTVLDRKDLPKAVNMIRRTNPKAFVSIEDIREASEGHFPPHGKWPNWFWNRRRLSRKGV